MESYKQALDMFASVLFVARVIRQSHSVGSIFARRLMVDDGCSRSKFLHVYYFYSRLKLGFHITLNVSVTYSVLSAYKAGFLRHEFQIMQKLTSHSLLIKHFANVTCSIIRPKSIHEFSSRFPLIYLHFKEGLFFSWNFIDDCNEDY